MGGGLCDFKMEVQENQEHTRTPQVGMLVSSMYKRFDRTAGWNEGAGTAPELASLRRGLRTIIPGRTAPWIPMQNTWIVISSTRR